MSGPRVALKVDCDTFEGTRDGLPNLLRLLERRGIRASFFFTLGPDRSGRAVRRVFTQKGFLRKMLRSGAVSLYGPKTMLYGTLLPAPVIGEKLAPLIRSVESHGHEVGVHGWDHVHWHDHLARMNEEDVAREAGRAHESFAKIFGRPARCSAAPGWQVTETSLRVQEAFGLTFTSDTRGGSPFFPSAGPFLFSALEIPTTLPTWDEMLGAPACRGADDLLDFYRRSAQSTQVHTIHTEVEATAHLDLFERLIDAWKSDGVSFMTLGDYAAETLKKRAAVPRRAISLIEIPNRGGRVSSQVIERDCVHR